MPFPNQPANPQQPPRKKEWTDLFTPFKDLDRMILTSGEFRRQHPETGAAKVVPKKPATPKIPGTRTVPAFSPDDTAQFRGRS